MSAADIVGELLASLLESFWAKREPTGGGIPAGPEITAVEATDVRDPQLQPR